ncbi:MAG: hypothetical protein HRU17_19295 [Polyangiaceae bacterium]|nr:hypothetical protein [Polyangiaceae bacterium]
MRTPNGAGAPPEASSASSQPNHPLVFLAHDYEANVPFITLTPSASVNATFTIATSSSKPIKIDGSLAPRRHP